MFQQSIKVSLTAVIVEQLIYLLLIRCCVYHFCDDPSETPLSTWKTELF
jgi:hypothetical protein